MSINIGTLDIGVAFAGDTAGLQKATADAQQGIDRFGASTSKAMRQVREDTKGAEDALGRLSQGFKGAVIGSSVAVGLIKLKNTAVEVGDALIQAQVQLDKLNNGFKFGAGGSAGGARELSFVREEANRLGLELGGAATQYMKMVAAARGTNMEGAKTRELFTSIAEASTVMGMSGEQSERAMQAVVQMMSKGKVQAEELRGQLGEHLPGAFAIAARAMGVTEVELNKLMETGQVLSADFLPKFAAQLRNELGGSVEDATKSMQASLNRYETAWLTFKQNVAESGVSDVLGGQINILADAFNGVSERMEAARKAGGGFWSQTAAGAGGVAQFLNPINALSYSAISLQGQLEQAKTKLNELEKERPYSGNIFLGPAIEETKLLIAELERAKAARDQLARQPGTGASESRYSAMAEAEAIKAQQAKGLAYAKLMGDLATPQEKLTEAIFKAKQELGELYSPEIEARLREHFIKPTREAKKEVDDLTKAAVRGEKLFGDLSATEGGLAGDFSEKWGELSAAYAKTYINAEQLLAAQAALLKLQPFYKKGLDEEKEAAKEQAKATAEAAKAYDAYYDAVQKNTDTLQGNIQSENDAAAAIGLSAIAIAELEAVKLQDMAASKERAALTWESIDLSGEMTAQLRAEAKALRDLAAAKVNRAVKDTAYDEAKKAADAWQKASEQIEKDITDALMRGFESGKDFAMVLRDAVVNMFKTMVLRPVISAIVNPLAGAVTGSLGLAGTANAATGAANLLGGLGSIGSIGGMAESALINSGATYGTGFMSQQSAMLAAQEAGTLGAASSGVMSGLGAIGSTIGAFGTGMAASFTSAVSAGVGGWATAAGSLIGTGTSAGIAAGLGMVAAPLAAAALLWQPMFGRKLKDQGLQGEFGGEAGFTGENYQFYKGGWFRSDKTKTSALDADMQSGLANQFKALQLQTTLMAAALGDTGQSVADFTSSIKVSFNGLTEAQIGEKLTETFTGIANDLAKTVLGDSAFAKEGEAASQTLARLSTSLTTVNATFDTLGFSLEAISLTGADAASDFIDLIGGLDAFKAATAGYYANFYTETERTAFATEQLTEAMGKLGKPLPATRDGFRALVEAAEKAGDNALLAGLLNLQDEFAALTPTVEAAATAVAKANEQALASQSADRKAELAARRAAEAQAAEAMAETLRVYQEGAEQFDTLRQSLLLAGDAAGLLAATTERAFANPNGKYTAGGVQYDAPQWTETTTAAQFNYAYGVMAARLRRDLSDDLSANALRVQNVGPALSKLSVGNMMSQYDPVTGPVYLGIRDAIVQAAGDASYAVRDAVDGAALVAAQTQVRSEFSALGPGLASVYAAMAQPQVITDNARAYNDAVGKLNGAMRSGAISTEQFGKALEALESVIPNPGSAEDIAAAVQSAQYAIGRAGFDSINYYFSALGGLAAELAAAAAEAVEPIATMSASIGRLNSFATAFGVSAQAAMSLPSASIAGGGLSLEYAAGTIGTSALISQAAAIASSVLTTADAAAAAKRLAETTAFTDTGAVGLRNAGLLLDGIRQNDAASFENAFIRITDSFAKGNLTGDQFTEVFADALTSFQGVDEETQALTRSMETLRDAMGGFADQLLIDSQRTTLSAGQTLAEMQRQYAVAYTSAMTGDAQATSQFQSLGTSLLSKNLYASQADYNDAFGKVVGDAQRLEVFATNTINANANQQNAVVSELREMNSALNNRVESLEKNLTAALAVIARNTAKTSQGIEQINVTGVTTVPA